MTSTAMLTQETVLFLKMTARSVKVGDILRTRWGLRELLSFKYVTGEYDTVEVLIP